MKWKLLFLIVLSSSSLFAMRKFGGGGSFKYEDLDHRKKRQYDNQTLPDPKDPVVQAQTMEMSGVHEVIAGKDTTAHKEALVDQVDWKEVANNPSSPEAQALDKAVETAKEHGIITPEDVKKIEEAKAPQAPKEAIINEPVVAPVIPQMDNKPAPEALDANTGAAEIVPPRLSPVVNEPIPQEAPVAAPEPAPQAAPEKPSTAKASRSFFGDLLDRAKGIIFGENEELAAEDSAEVASNEGVLSEEESEELPKGFSQISSRFTGESATSFFKKPSTTNQNIHNESRSSVKKNSKHQKYLPKN